MIDPLPVPEPVRLPPRRGLPVVATVAPVLLSVGLWLVTSSPSALLFAALGPVVAVAGVVDARLGARRTARREHARLDRELAALADRIEQAHEVERAARERAHPTARAALGAGVHDPERWRGSLAEAVLVVGRGRAASGTRLAASDDPRVSELARRAAVLEDAPVTVPALGGLAVVGDGVRARALVRAALLALLTRLPPDGHELAVPPEQEGEWRGLPLQIVPDPTLRADELAVRELGRGSTGQDARQALLAVTATAAEAPSSCRTVVVLADAPEVVRADDPAVIGDLAPDYLGDGSGPRAIERIAELARADRVLASRQALPEHVALAPLLPLAGEGRDSLAAVIGVAADGPLLLDLVAHGPHAVIGGMTGSGKSELLVAWALSLAWAHPPAELALLLVDFKGGASFGPLEALPHVVGVLSDLDEAGAARALASLSAEVRHRERVLADARARSIEALAGGSLARLVIVVDEFAALVGGFPELHATIADIAARGRSLGMHLVLCTQRPAGAVRDTVLANASARVSLRVNNAADSLAVVGSDAASTLPASVPGRALVSTGGAPVVVQTALAQAEDAAVVLQRWRDAPPPRRPWLAPLPAVVPIAALVPDGEPKAGAEAPGLAFAVADEPERQRRTLVRLRPEEHGPLVVLGAPRSGRTGVLEVLAAQADSSPGAGAAAGAPGVVARDVRAAPAGRSDRAAIVPPDPETVWDAVHEPTTAPLLLDDLDLALARMPDEHAHELVGRLALALREAPASGRLVAITAATVPSMLQSALAGTGDRLLLRHAGRSELVLAGGRGEDHDPAAPPGRGTLRGRTVQVGHASRSAPRAQSRIHDYEPGRRALAVVATDARALAESARAAGVTAAVVIGEAGESAVLAASAPRVVIGDPDAWASLFTALPALATRRDVLLVGCSTAQVRTALRTRELPPLVAGSGAALLHRPDRTLRRVRVLPWNPQAVGPETH